MSKYVVDAWAWIEFCRGIRHDVKSMIEGSATITSPSAVAEVASKFNKEGLDADEAVDAIESLSEVVPVDANFAKGAGILHSVIKKKRTNFSLADAFVLYTARATGAKILTGDPDFKGLKEAILFK